MRKKGEAKSGKREGKEWEKGGKQKVEKGRKGERPKMGVWHHCVGPVDLTCIWIGLCVLRFVSSPPERSTSRINSSQGTASERSARKEGSLVVMMHVSLCLSFYKRKTFLLLACYNLQKKRGSWEKWAPSKSGAEAPPPHHTPLNPAMGTSRRANP